MDFAADVKVDFNWLERVNFRAFSNTGFMTTPLFETARKSPALQEISSLDTVLTG